MNTHRTDGGGLRTELELAQCADLHPRGQLIRVPFISTPRGGGRPLFRFKEGFKSEHSHALWKREVAA